MMDRLVAFGLYLSGISFALFVLSLLVSLWINLFPRAPAGGAGGAGDVEQEGAVGDAAKLFEAFSKLADSLNHSSPVVLSLMASIIFFALALLGAGLGATKQKDDKKEEKKTKISMATEVCVFAPFETGKHELSKAVIDQLDRDSDGCGMKLLNTESTATASLMLLVGHSDHRNLGGRQSANYGTNETLAYQRALAVKNALLAKYALASTHSYSSIEAARRMIIVEGGPSYLDRSTSAPQLAEDRSVEVISFGLASPDGDSSHP